MVNRISRKPPRWKDNYTFYFLTFCTFKKRKLLHKKEIQKIILDDLRFYKNHLKEIIAYTIMPDHMHLLVEVDEARTLSVFLQRFKSHTSKKIQEVLKNNCEPIWQRGTMDHCIRDINDFENHLAYLFYNSSKHLGILPKDFPNHNFKKVVELGWLEEDFYAFSDKKEMEFEKYE